MKQNTSKKHDDAVSPVIGVMLMLVVTIIVAAFVTAFSSGLVDTESTAPVAYLDVEILANQGDTHDQYVLNIKHMGGDVLDTADLKIISDYSYDDYNADTQKVTPVRKSSTITPATTKTQIIKSPTKISAKVPYLSDITVGDPSHPDVQFGAFDLEPGDVMTTGTSIGTYKVIGGATSAPNGFGVGSKVDISIIHTPSDTTIFNEEVRVQ